MIYFNNDYSEGCHPRILEKLTQTNFVQTPGYGEDIYCAQASEKIRTLCEDPDLAVHYLVGGTQSNLVVIAASLRPHQAVIGADCAHINTHETGSIEATGHKVVWLPSELGKIRAAQVRELVENHRQDPSFEHIPQPKMVYISQPTEYGTLYTKSELQSLSDTCRDLGMYLFLDGARLGYGLMAQGNDASLADIARLCDVFYIGGTKVGALFGEAVVIRNSRLKEDFRFIMKQRGAMLAKGRLLGVQFLTLFEDDLYFSLGRHADELADRIRLTLQEAGCPFLMENTTNQLFPILPDNVLEALKKTYAFIEMDKIDEGHHAIRLCTSWATRPENVEALCSDLRRLLMKE